MRRSTSSSTTGSVPSWSSILARKRFERGQALAAHVVRGVARHLVGHLLEAGERRGVDHPGVVAHLVRERPAVRELRALGRELVAQHERDARVAERVDAGGDRQLGVAPERGQPFVVDPELLGRIERARPRRELDHGLETVDRLERGAAVLALDQSRDVLVEHVAAQAARDHVDPLLAVEQPARGSRRRRAARRRVARAPRR